MDYIKLGSTGLDVSPIAIGAMTYGDPSRGHPVWSLDEDTSRPLIKHALDAGINFFDTANLYSYGSSEEILGRALKDYADRDDVVIATKLRNPMRLAPNGKGLSRKAIMSEVEHSLKRLGTDYIDLYQIHRNDQSTPLEETLEALHDLVKAGNVLPVTPEAVTEARRGSSAWEATVAAANGSLRQAAVEASGAGTCPDRTGS
jgi:1-deoxyxylulose-5-phosphate synthase